METEIVQQPEQNNTVALATGRQAHEVQAALVIAKKFPRDVQKALEAIKVTCARKGLAEQAVYQYARGGTNITGPSIRLAEAVAQHYGNIEFGFREIDRGLDENGVTYSVVEAYCWDQQSNVRKPLSFRVPHWRDTKKGGYLLTDERDIYELVANMAQRRVRACIMSVIPGDIFDDAVAQCEATLHAQADCSAENIKKFLSKFEEMKVTRAQIEKRIQRKIDSITPAQLVQLRKIYKSIQDGMSYPKDWFEAPEEAARPSEPINPFPQQEGQQSQDNTKQEETLL